MNNHHLGTLYIVATPLGHLQDMSQRAVDILQTVNLIAAEDTRHSLPLLRYYSIKTPIISFHMHNESRRVSEMLNHLQQGESIALISDAGTPLISDPGFLLVRKARDLGIKVVPIPGASALICALSASGLPTDRFVFEGFLPQRTRLRVARLAQLAKEERTMIFYEAPHRILAFLKELQAVFGEKREAVMARELTKMFETFLEGTLSDLYQTVKADDNQQRGEIVLLVASATPEVHPKKEKEEEIRKILTILLTECSLKQAVNLTAQLTDYKKNDIYDLALKMQKKG